MKTNARFCFVIALIAIAIMSNPTIAKHSNSAGPENLAVVIGEAGEQYPIYGAGGIRVSGGHHGMFASNMKSSSIEIDGSGITAQKYLTVIENEDFTAAAGGAYFATADVVCTLAAAASAAGQETVVCNTGKGASIKYKTAAGETVGRGSTRCYGQRDTRKSGPFYLRWSLLVQGIED
jgi:hypothetical protein